MTTDIDRLHDVVTGKLTGRGSGKTFAQCHELCGVLEVTDSELVVCSVQHMMDVRFIMDELTPVISEHEILILQSWQNEYVVYVDGKKKRIVFRNSDNHEDFAGLNCPIVEFTR